AHHDRGHGRGEAAKEDDSRTGWRRYGLLGRSGLKRTPLRPRGPPHWGWPFLFGKRVQRDGRHTRARRQPVRFVTDGASHGPLDSPLTRLTATRGTAADSGPYG